MIEHMFRSSGSRFVVILSVCVAFVGCSSKHRDRPLSYQQNLGQPTGAATFADVGSQVVLAAATTYPAPVEMIESQLDETEQEGIVRFELRTWYARAAP